MVSIMLDRLNGLLLLLLKALQGPLKVPQDHRGHLDG
jgi:hypothetical protein